MFWIQWAPNNLLGDIKDEYSAKVTEKFIFLGNLFNQDLENMVDHGCPKTRDLVDPKAFIEGGFAQITHSYTSSIFNVQSEKKSC